MVYNEADILGQLLDHLFKNGISFVVLDGGSDDGSKDIAQEYREKGLLEFKAYRTEAFHLRELLERSLEMARQHNPDWIIRNDADEFFEAPEVGRTLSEAIAEEDRRSYNLIQFNNFEFCLTEKDSNLNEPDVIKKLRFYTWSDDFRYKAWKYYGGTTDRETGGHYPIFPRGVRPRLSPRKFVMRHYRFRTPDQAIRRVFKERLPRFDLEERVRKKWHLQYDHFRAERDFFIVDSTLLATVNGNHKWDTTNRFDWYAGFLFPSREEILLVLKLQEVSGLFSTWRLLHYYDVLGKRILVHRALQFVRKTRLRRKSLSNGKVSIVSSQET